MKIFRFMVAIGIAPSVLCFAVWVWLLLDILYSDYDFKGTKGLMKDWTDMLLFN